MDQEVTLIAISIQSQEKVKQAQKANKTKTKLKKLLGQCDSCKYLASNFIRKKWFHRNTSFNTNARITWNFTKYQ